MYTQLPTRLVYDNAVCDFPGNFGCYFTYLHSAYVCTQMLGSMKRQFVELLADIGFIHERLTSRDIERMLSQGSDGVLAATGPVVSFENFYSQFIIVFVCIKERMLVHNVYNALSNS